VTRLAPVLVGGNTAVVIASEHHPLAAATLAEVLATSDVPGGVVNILTGREEELASVLASHMDVNALDLAGAEGDTAELERLAADNVKRVVRNGEGQSPWHAAAYLELKTVCQAISEGDGISVIPMLVGDVEALAALAEEAGAEAVAVASDDVARACAATALPVLAQNADLEAAAAAGADACVLRSDDGLPEQHERARELGLDCVVDVRDEEALQEVLEHVDPDIVLLSEHELEDDEEDFERTLDLLADVPAGKLVITDARVIAREQVVALERAGVDAILVSGELLRPDFAATLAELTGRA